MINKLYEEAFYFAEAIAGHFVEFSISSPRSKPKKPLKIEHIFNYRQLYTQSI